MQDATQTPRKFKNVTKQDPADRFRISNGMTLTVTKALRDQLTRYCQAHPRAHKQTGELKPMSTSKAIRYAVYEAMENPSTLSNRPKVLPTFLPLPDFDRHLSWTFDKPQDREHLDTLCKTLNITASTLTRRAIYNYTKEHVSTDTKEHIDAACGWE